MELTEKHIQKMKHALGNGSRNFYGVRKPDPAWEELVEAKYATRDEVFGETVYHVTKQGKAALKRVIG